MYVTAKLTSSKVPGCPTAGCPDQGSGRRPMFTIVPRNPNTGSAYLFFGETSCYNKAYADVL